MRSEVTDDTGNAKRDADKTIYALSAIFGTKTCVGGEGGGGGSTAPAAPSPMYIPIFYLVYFS